MRKLIRSGAVSVAYAIPRRCKLLIPNANTQPRLMPCASAFAHECGVAMVRLLKPLSYYQEKYGSPLWGFTKLFLLMEKEAGLMAFTVSGVDCSGTLVPMDGTDQGRACPRALRR